MTAKWPIYIIYNPISTGNSHGTAKSAASRLKRLLPDSKITLVPSEYAGHAEELAFEFASKKNRPLIISSSGDGGYHEVINGIMRASKRGRPAIAGLLPAGNADDHFHSLHEDDFFKQVSNQSFRTIDVLKFVSRREGQAFVRYAHSYIGFGLTPSIGLELTRHKLTWLNEKWITFVSFLRFKPVVLVVAGQPLKYQSVTITNIDRMAKFLRFGPLASTTDGIFEIKSLQYRTKFMLVIAIVAAVFNKFKPSRQASEFELTTVTHTLVQFDGETATVDANAHVHITVEPGALDCIV